MRRASDCLQCVGEILEAEVNGRLTDRSDGDPGALNGFRKYLEEWPDDALEMLVADFGNREAVRGRVEC